ncbi:DUF4430 domain-containing protein [Desulfosporosinus shakirovi]|uniref:DUF4430 domain-containing protein n=1 Tax=Desulfosporosinus shakirovi TaxID=2885154 RepID=UPI001E56C28D|nr:DUF4430 domain-containing protein [Desulfosporosinus sp. SRJS8]MCB8817452.1 DUF4430 domain-containing protein [Desulfosporosinus sp. SRJS8]
MKKVLNFLVLIMLLVLALTGCGGASVANGDPPGEVITTSVTDSDQKTADSSELKSTGQSTDQQLTNSEIDPVQPSPENKESSASPNTSQPGSNDSSSSSDSGAGADAVVALTIPPVISTLSPALEPNTSAKNTVTFSINCQTAVDKGLHLTEQFQEVVPANGIILPPTVLEFKEGEVVFDILKQVVRQEKIHMEYEGSKGTPYIQGINNLYEFDGGPLSGWMYCVNKIYPNYGCGEYKLKQGDVIEWNYTCDLGKDLGQTWMSE